jgi:hypothetical protein
MAKEKSSAEAEQSQKKQQIPGVFKLLGQALVILRSQWKLFLGISVIYAALGLLSGGFSIVNSYNQTSDAVDQIYEESGGSLVSNISNFSFLLGSSNGAAGSGVSLVLLWIVASLAVIWALRQVYAGKGPKVRDSFYKGMYPLVPFVLILLLIFVQLLPAALMAGLFGIVTATGLVANFIEQAIWLFLLAGGLGLSVYWISTSGLALYIVSLPDVVPMQAWHSAKDLVKGRRLAIIGRMIFLPLALLVIACVITLPFLFIAAGLAGWVFLTFAAVLVVLAHSYMYALYRSLL